MCRFKRLAVKIKRKAGWGRSAKHPAVTRPTETVIEKQKYSAERCRRKNMKRRAEQDKKEESTRREEFFNQKGWAT